jgi:hypothetical protein
MKTKRTIGHVSLAFFTFTAAACDNNLHIGNNGTGAPDAQSLDGSAGNAEAGGDHLPSVGEPCCDIGPLQRLGLLGQQGSPPVVVWNGESWTVAWQAFETKKLTIGTIEPAKGLLVEQKITDEVFLPYAGAWGGKELALLGNTEVGRKNIPVPKLLLLASDHSSRNAVYPPEPFEEGALVLWKKHNAWAVLGKKAQENSSKGVVGLRIYDRNLSTVPITDTETGFLRIDDAFVGGDLHSLALVETSRGLTTANAGATFGWRMHTFGDSIFKASPASPAQIDQEDDFLFHSPQRVDTFGLAALNGVVFGAVSVPGFVLGWSHTIGVANERTDPILIDTTNTPYTTSAPGMDADDLGGTVGICYLDGDLKAQEQSVKFAVINAKGERIGTPVTVVEKMHFSNYCAVSAGPANTFLVSAWLSGGPTAEPMVAVKVRIRR